MNELQTISPDVIASIVINGDLSKLSPAQKVELYNFRCHQAGLDPSAKPFDLLTLNGKQILYANAGATQQLTSTRSLSHQVTNRELVDGIYCVFVRVTDKDGRCTENMGAVPVESLKGEAKANAMLKATTKAIRRAVLAHCGLGLMDETEVETIPGASKAAMPTLSSAPKPEPFNPIEWTEEEEEQARMMVADLAEELMQLGVDETSMRNQLSKPSATVGDPTITMNTWTNRFLGFRERQVAKAKNDVAA